MLAVECRSAGTRIHSPGALFLLSLCTHAKQQALNRDWTASRKAVRSTIRGSFRTDRPTCDLALVNESVNEAPLLLPP